MGERKPFNSQYEDQDDNSFEVMDNFQYCDSLSKYRIHGCLSPSRKLKHIKAMRSTGITIGKSNGSSGNTVFDNMKNMPRTQSYSYRESGGSSEDDAVPITLQSLAKELFCNLRVTYEGDNIEDAIMSYCQKMNALTTPVTLDMMQLKRQELSMALPIDRHIFVSCVNFCTISQHNLLPQLGTVHFAYLPALKKPNRDLLHKLVESHTKIIQSQQALTDRLAYCLADLLMTRSVGTMIKTINTDEWTKNNGNKRNYTNYTYCLVGNRINEIMREFHKFVEHS